MPLLILLAIIVWSLICIYVGIFIGIKDCKRTYDIPFGVVPSDGLWLSKRTMEEIYGLLHDRDTVSTEQ